MDVQAFPVFPTAKTGGVWEDGQGFAFVSVGRHLVPHNVCLKRRRAVEGIGALFYEQFENSHLWGGFTLAFHRMIDIIRVMLFDTLCGSLRRVSF